MTKEFFVKGERGGKEKRKRQNEKKKSNNGTKGNKEKEKANSTKLVTSQHQHTTAFTHAVVDGVIDGTQI